MNQAIEMANAAKISKSGARIMPLDGWRGISILLVVGSHLVNQRYGFASNPVLDGFAFHLAAWGVDIFFVVSGFIITKLALAEYRRTGGFSSRDFYLRRIFRIIPPYFLYLVCIFLASRFGIIVQTYSGIAAAAAFSCNLPITECSGFVGHTWSLAYEEQFYIVFPLLFAATCWYSRQLFLIVLLCLVALPFARYFFHLGWIWRDLAVFVTKFSFICIGAALAINEERIKRLSQARGANYVSGVVVLVLFGLLLSDVMPVAYGEAIVHMRSALNDIALPLGIAWLVGVSTHQSNVFTKLLVAPPLLFIGTISYSLYLWQQLFTAAPTLYLVDAPFLAAPMMFVVAAASYYLVERPSARLGKRFAGAQISRVPSAVSSASS